jgi:hypothetical protein
MVVQEDILDAITVIHPIDPNQGNLEEVEALEDIQHQPLELLVLHQEVEVQLQAPVVHICVRIKLHI